MTRRSFLLTYILIVSLGLFGMWLGFRTYDPSDSRYLLGFLMVLGATSMLIIVFRRDLHVPEGEKKTEWGHTREKGKWRFILRQMLGGLLGFSPYLIVRIYEARKSSGEVVRRLSRLGVETAIVIGLCFLVALLWWRYKEWMYAGSFKRGAQPTNGMQRTRS